MRTATKTKREPKAISQAKHDARVSAIMRRIIHIDAQTADRIDRLAAQTGNSRERFTALLLDYALAKLEAGEIELIENDGGQA